MKWKNRVIHAGVLVLVFLAAVVIFGYVTNKKNSNMTTDMGAATRPQIAFSYNGYSLNDLPGYKNEMDLTGVRDSITPVSNGQLQVTIKAYENVIDSLDYTVYSIDGKEKLLEQKVKKPGENATLEVGNVDGENILSEERMLQITLHMDNHDMYYYTRIVDGAKLNAAPSLDYVQSFHENALAKAEGVGIGTAIEPSDEGDNTTLQHVTIHSDYTHVTWGDLAPKVDGSERWTIKELNSTYMAVELEYRVNCTGEENEQDEYQVREYFRVRYISGSQKTYLLDYDRTMDQIFDATKKVLNEKGVLLGITDKNPVYMVNKNGTVVSFVQAGELWNYNRDRDEVSLVFSFADAENTDTRNMLMQHDIKILNLYFICNRDILSSDSPLNIRFITHKQFQCTSSCNVRKIKITFIVFLTVQQGLLYIDVIYAVIMSYHREFLTSIIAGIKIELYFIKNRTCNLHTCISRTGRMNTGSSQHIPRRHLTYIFIANNPFNFVCISLFTCIACPFLSIPGNFKLIEQKRNKVHRFIRMVIIFIPQHIRRSFIKEIC